MVATTVYAAELHEPLTTPELQQLATTIAKAHGIEDIWRFLFVINCESGWDPSVHSNFYHNGKRENSWGLAQIFLDVHTNVTRSQAKDPYFALTWAAEHWNDEPSNWRTCYKKSNELIFM